ncbi:hypothetical protein GOBAR_DD34592 [Gossypium barbadense]|nr:hypothetical protein GOBAR_DD34592 [Gossypium barbadense]
MSSEILISSNDQGDNGGTPMKIHITKKGGITDDPPLGYGIINEEDLVFVEGDILRSNVNVISTIDFSDRLKKCLVKDMETTVVPVEAISKHGSGVDPFFDGIRGQFARMVVFVYLEKPLVSQILTIGKLQRVEFESLLAIRFSYGCYGHLKDVYLYNGSDLNSVAGKE